MADSFDHCEELVREGDKNRFLATLFPPADLTDTFGEIVAKAGMTQLRIAETEKYAHVTFFFNGGREAEFPGEDRILVPSPKVATYDKQPQMSAPEVTDKVVEAIKSGKFDVVVLNYANTDMVGHTGLIDAAVHAVETVDRSLGRLAEAVEAAGGTLVVTADHGNAEMMRDPKTGAPHTAHTLNPAPFIVVNPPASVRQVERPPADVAPTLLALLTLPAPAAMTGHSLLGAGEARQRAVDKRRVIQPWRRVIRRRLRWSDAAAGASTRGHGGKAGGHALDTARPARHTVSGARARNRYQRNRRAGATRAQCIAIAHNVLARRAHVGALTSPSASWNAAQKQQQQLTSTARRRSCSAHLSG